MANSTKPILYSLLTTHYSPFLTERTYLELEGPGAPGLLVQLPIGRCNRSGRHQQIRIIQRFLAPKLLAALPHPGRIDAGIDDQVRNMDVFGAELTGHRLRHGTKPELRAGKGRKTTSAAQ